VNDEPHIKEGDLLPCPFCGGEADVSAGTQGQIPWWYVECIKCAALCNSVEDWNRRAAPAAPEDNSGIVNLRWSRKGIYSAPAAPEGRDMSEGMARVAEAGFQRDMEVAQAVRQACLGDICALEGQDFLTMVQAIRALDLDKIVKGVPK